MYRFQLVWPAVFKGLQNSSDKHLRKQIEWFENRKPNTIFSFRVVHKDNKMTLVPHGRCETWYDNTMVERAGLRSEIAGLQKEEMFDNGKSLGFAVYDRKGKKHAATGMFR